MFLKSKPSRILLMGIACTLLLVGVYYLIQLALLTNRPMFCNEPVRSDHMLFAMWTPPPPRQDSSGNVIIADYELNLLVVFQVAGSELKPTRFWWPTVTSDGVTFPDTQSSGRDNSAPDDLLFAVPKCSDRLFIFAADGSCKQFPLAAGGAEKIHTLLKEPVDDVGEIISQL